jgi:hypothetical protein
MKRFIYNLFFDNNDINEKAVIGFISFIMLVITFLVDIITGLLQIEFPIHEFIFDGFLIMTLGSFGIATVDKIVNKIVANKKNTNL